MTWTKIKPKTECVFATAVKIRGNWEYSIFEITKMYDGDDQWYYGIIDSNGDEWGPLEDLTADLYCVLPLIK